MAGDDLTKPRPKSFWDEAASRVQPSSFRDTPPDETRKPLRRDPPPAVEPLSVTDDQLQLRLSEEVDYARRMLALMGDQLSADRTVIIRHGSALQSLDIVSQMLGHIAAVIRSGSPDDAVDRIGMTELKSRLQRRKL